MGKFTLDPATANNNMHHPLIIFNPISGQVFYPPRIYISEKYVPKKSSLKFVKSCIPKRSTLKNDLGELSLAPEYIEIETVDTYEKFIAWASTPLGSWKGDADYHKLYRAVKAPFFRSSLEGLTPGYWNYYGTNNFHLHDVIVKSVTIEEENIPSTYDGSEADCPPEVKAFIGASLTYNASVKDDSTNSAKMVDALPVMNVYSQLFCDWLTLYKGREVLFRGNPNKGSLRLVNPSNVVNENMPYSGAGKFISTIPHESIISGLDAPVLEFFQKKNRRANQIKGIYIQQVLSAIEERRPMNYQEFGNVSSPAFGVVSGTIAPWYEGEMKSWTTERQLVGDQAFITKKSKKYDIPKNILSPTVFKVDQGKGRLDIDLSTVVPMQNMKRSKKNEPIVANPYEQNSYELYDLGKLTFVFENIDNNHIIQDKWVVGSIKLDRKNLSRTTILSNGGIFSLFFNPSEENLQKASSWQLSVYGKDDQKKKVRFMSEAPIVIMTDESALYCDQNDDPVKGYISNSGTREPCRLRIFRLGQPVNEEIEINILAYKMINSGATQKIAPFRKGKYKDGDIVTFPTDEPSSVIYQFFAHGLGPISPHSYPALLVWTGFFVNVRVLPKYDFSIYLNPKHPDYSGPVTFEILLKEIFASYHLLYPIMNFSSHSWENVAMAKYLQSRISLENWHKPWYMPLTRDLSESQRELICAWIDRILGEERQTIEEEIHAYRSFHSHIKHLSQKVRFR